MKNNKKKLKAPKLRFPEFTDDWEECEFGKISQIRHGLTYKPSDVQQTGIRVLRSSNINEDTFVLRSDDVFVKSKSVNIDEIKNGDILITSANGSSRLVGKHAIINGIDNKTVHGGFMLVASTDNPQFVNTLMSSNWYSKFINIFVSGGNGAIGNLSKSHLENQKILVPNKDEQAKIGKFFKEIDQLITLNQNKISHIKDLKAGLLQKMFPKNGETKPEIRFDGFTSDWKEFTFNEFTEYESSNYSARQFKGCNLSGKYKVFDANKEIACINEFDQQKEYISIIKDGAGIGRTEIRPAKSSIIGTMGYIKSTNSDLYFVYFLMKNIRWDNYQNGSTIPHIYYKDYGNEKFFIPKIEEQQKIGEFFSQLDNLLTLYQRKLEHLQEQKKSLLKQMFI